MKNSYIYLGIALYIIAIFFAYSTGMIKTIKILTLIPIVLIILQIVKNQGFFSLLFFSVLIYWIPFTFSLFSFLKDFTLIEISVYFIVFIVIINQSISNNPRVNQTIKKYPFWPFIIFFIGALIGHFISNNPSHLLIKTRQMFLWPILFCFVCIYLIRNTNQLYKILWGFLISSVIFALLVLFGDTFLGIGHKVIGIETDYRLTYYLSIPYLGEIHMHMIQIGQVFAVILICYFVIWLNYPSRIIRGLAPIVMMLFIALIIKSQARGAIVAIIIASIVISLLSMFVFKQKKLQIKVFIFLFIIIGLFVYTAIQSQYNPIYTRGEETLSNPLEAKTFISRLNIWERAVPLITKSIFGFGLGAFPLIEDGNTAVVHNIFLFNYFVTGLIGFIAFLLIHFYIIKYSYTGLKKSTNFNLKLIFLMGIGVETVWLSCGMVSHMSYYGWGLAVFWIIPGLVFAAANLSKSKLI